MFNALYHRQQAKNIRRAIVWRAVRYCLFAAAMLASVGAHAQTSNSTATVRMLGGGDLSGWEYRAFDGITETRYTARFDDELQAAAVFADSMQGASGYIKKTSIDLNKTPWLHFRWRVDEVGGDYDERQKIGDDFAFRIYFSGRDEFSYKSLSLVRGQGNRGEHWHSPYANVLNDLHTYVVIGGDAPLSAWQTAHVNVREIWQKLFDEKPPPLGLIGFMTDGDSAGNRMRARYGDIILSDSEQSPF